MNDLWAIAMVVSGGLFAGGVVSIALERVPAWRTGGTADFRTSFVHTLRRVDRLQPALLSIWLIATIGFALTETGPARTLALVAAAGSLLILAGSVMWLVPIQRSVKSGTDQAGTDLERLRARWVRGHLARTVGAVSLLIVAVVATTV
jgi:Domain of unknown function (DUF1772)